MLRSFILLLLVGCTNPADPLLGGQEGEPAQPPGYEGVPAVPPPPMAPGDPDVDSNGACEVVAHCEGDEWCADYSANMLPDLEAECAGHWADGPCDTELAVGTCALGSDRCTVVWLFTDDDRVCSTL